MKQRGATAVEFAVCIVIYFTALFSTLELARALYLNHTLQEVTRRAAARAAVSDFSDPLVMQALRSAAVLRDSPGLLLLGAPVSDAYVRIEYLSLARSGSGGLTLTPIPAASMPACPARARINCAADPNGAHCIRFVRASICAPDSAGCGTVQYQPVLPLTAIKYTLPPSVTIAKAESLGFEPGSTLCP